MHPSGVAQSGIIFVGGKRGNVTAAGWQVTLCDLIWHVSSASDEAARAACKLLCALKVQKSKVQYTDIAVRNLTATGTHMPYGIPQCYLPPDRGNIPAFTSAEAGTRLSDPGGMQG